MFLQAMLEAWTLLSHMETLPWLRGKDKGTIIMCSTCQALCQLPRIDNIVKKENTFNWLCDLSKIWRLFKPPSSPLENGNNNAAYLSINKSMKGDNPCKVGPHRRVQQTSNIIIPRLYLAYYIKLPVCLFIYVFIHLSMNHWIHFQPFLRSDYQLLTRSLKYMTTNITQELEEALWTESRMPLSVQEWVWIRFLWLIPYFSFSILMGESSSVRQDFLVLSTSVCLQSPFFFLSPTCVYPKYKRVKRS